VSEELDLVWQRMRDELRASSSEAAFETWLAPLVPVARRDSRLILSAPSQARRWLEERYLGLISSAAAHAVGAPVTVELVDEGAESMPDTELGGAEADARAPAGRLNPRYTFDGFVISAGNRLAHASALAVAEQPAQAYNPLFLHGPPGLGKTHLLHAIGHYVRAYALELRVAYTTVETFTGEFVAAARHGDFTRFHARFRDVDVLLVDDVQFLAHRAGTMEAFFHTFNALYEAGAQLVLTSDRPPGELGELEERLQERFKCGLVAPVEHPDLTARMTILRKRVCLDAVDGIGDEVLGEVAQMVPHSVRSLEGALIRLVAYTSLTGDKPTPELVRKVLGGLASTANGPSPRHSVRIDDVKHATAEAFDLTSEALDASDRRARVAFARQVAMYLTRELTEETLPAIGAAFGGRRHPTVAHACRRVEQAVIERPEARTVVDNLKARLGGSG
jgi:chromosomal replication initiator protein